MSGRDLVTHLAEFARALRARGLGVGLSDEVDAAGALTLVDLLDLAEVRCAFRTALKIRRADWEVFDDLFRPGKAKERRARDRLAIGRADARTEALLAVDEADADAFRRGVAKAAAGTVGLLLAVRWWEGGR